MNKYLISVIELLVFGTIAYFLGKNIQIFTDDDSLVNLNYIFWGFVALLSILTNFKLFLYFGTVFVIGILFFGIYIYKIVRVSTFVNLDMTFLFWILFATFFIPILVLLITKRMLLTASNTEAPRGNRGNIGDSGERGTSYFIESLGDRAYTLIITKLEEYFKDILDKNEIDYDPNTPQINNMYFKNNLKRICNSKQFIDKIKSGYSRDGLYDECKFVDITSGERKCSLRYTVPSSTQPVISDKKCDSDLDCLDNTQVKSYSESIDINDKSSEMFLLLIRAKYWIRIILENNCEEDRKLRGTKAAKYYNLEQIGFIDNFKDFHELDTRSEVKKDNYLNGNTLNFLRMNNQQGRDFLQDHFQNDKYWSKYNVKQINRNPFDIIKNDEKWNWGNIVQQEKCL